MEWKFWIFLIILVVIAGCIQPSEEKSIIKSNETIDNKTVNKTNETVEFIVAGPCNGTSRYEVDVCLSNNGLCWNIENITLRDDCYYNHMNCSKILDPEKSNACNLKIKLIECEGTTDESFCKAIVTGDYIYCGTNTDCVVRFAYRMGDLKPCNLLGNIDNSTCIAVTLRNYSKCYELELYEASQKECIKRFSKYTGIDGDICNKLETISYKDNCYYGVAEATGAYSNCLLINSYNLHRDCLTTVAINTINQSICDNMRLGISSYQLKKDIAFCKMRVGQINYKPWVCQEIEDPGYKWGCFADSIIDGKTKKEDCALIDNKTYPEWYTECYKRAV